VRHATVAALWGYGVVWVKDWVKDSRVQSGNLTLVEAIRMGAEYGCKYAAKDWSDEVLTKGAHRYEIAQRYQPRCHKMIVARLATALTVVNDYFGRPADHLWSHEEAPDWYGPPVWCMTWRLGALPGDDGPNDE
jgi:hypothetical protein